MSLLADTAQSLRGREASDGLDRCWRTSRHRCNRRSRDRDRVLDRLPRYRARAVLRHARFFFEAGGFTGDDCEYLVIDNTGAEQVSAYRGLNAILAAARGRYVILCHQDVRLLDDGRFDLESCLSQLTARDCEWALAGNAGAVRAGKLAVCITDPHGANQRAGTLPAKVETLDENFIVLRRAAHVGFSRDLTGFHFYGADICLGADLMGYAAYVIDFHLQHLSAGKKGASFADCEDAFRRK